MRPIFKVNIFKLLVALVFLVFIIPQSAVAAEGFKLSATSEKGDIGDQVSITIKVENAAGTEGGQFLLTFNPVLVKPVSIETEELIEKAKSGMQMGNLEYAPGQLMFMWVTAYADTADSGNICRITFDLLQEGETLLEFDEIVVAPDGIGTIVTDVGKVTIGDAGIYPEESKSTESDSGVDEPLDSDNDQNTNAASSDEISDESITEDDGDNNLSTYAIGLVALVVLVTIVYAVTKRLKKHDVKKIQR